MGEFAVDVRDRDALRRRWLSIGFTFPDITAFIPADEDDELASELILNEETYYGSVVGAVAIHLPKLLQSRSHGERWDFNWPDRYRADYEDDGRRLLLELNAPDPSLVPDGGDFSWDWSGENWKHSAPTRAERELTYRRFLASYGLAVAHFCTEAFGGGLGSAAEYIDSVTLNVRSEAYNPRFGRRDDSCLLSFEATRTWLQKFCVFEGMAFDSVAVLLEVPHRWSRDTIEMRPCEPLWSPRQGASSTSVSLSRLTPYQFEQLISEVLRGMGLNARTTQASRDGGVDVVAVDNRPIVGGTVAVQAKLYSSPVGVGAVRDLYGTITHLRASKGVLIASSGFSSEAVRFAADKPIELIDGEGFARLAESAIGKTVIP